MSARLMMRAFWALFLGLVVLAGVEFRSKPQGECELAGRYARRHYAPLLEPTYLLLVYGIVLALFLPGGSGAAEALGRDLLLTLFPFITLYHALLLVCSGAVRRRFSAEVCAALWILPNLFYFFIYDFMWLDRPLLVIPLGRFDPAPLAIVWAAGAAGMMIYYTVSHLRFRRQALADSREAEGPALRVWERELMAVCNKRPGQAFAGRLLVAPHVRAPLSVGLLPWRVAVLLPDKAYTEEELTLILRHELIHIARGDTRAKLFLAVCTAVCWWNPLMRPAMRRCAADLELTCDELVLLDADPGRRRAYAELILSESADARGFTTCLTGAAESMRYRLKSIVEPAARRAGGWLIAAVFALSVMCFGLVSVSYGARPAGERLPEIAPTSIDGELSFGAHRRYEDGGAFMQYLRALPTARLSGAYTLETSSQLDDRWVRLGYETADGYMSCELTQYSLRVGREVFYLPERPDWAQIASLLSELPPEPEAPGVPALYYSVGGAPWERLFAVRTVLRKAVGGEEQELPLSDPFGWDMAGGVWGREVEAVTLAFDLPPDDYTVTAQDERGGTFYVKTMRELPDFTLPGTAVNTRYTVDASFTAVWEGGVVEYEVRYYFLIMPESE